MLTHGAGGLFLETGPGNFTGLNIQLSNCNPLIMKSWSFVTFFNVRKAKMIAKFDDLEPRRCDDKNGIVAPEIGPKSFGTWIN